jgi:hypothetical protein
VGAVATVPVNEACDIGANITAQKQAKAIGTASPNFLPLDKSRALTINISSKLETAA